MSTEEQIVEMYKKGFGGTRISDALDVDKNMVYSVLEKHGIPRRDAGSYDFTVEWRKMRRKGYGKTFRVVTLPRKYIEEAGFDPHSELEGKWEVSGRALILHIREVEGESLLSEVKTKLLGGDKE